MLVIEPTCTVVVCTRDRPAELERCLRAVRQIEYPRIDVLVIDNAPVKTPAREAAERWGARYVVEPVKGLSPARNRGALESRGEILAYIDDDAVPEPQWLSSIALAFEDSRVMAAAGRVIPFKPSQTDGAVSLPDARQGRAQRVVDSAIPIGSRSPTSAVSASEQTWHFGVPRLLYGPDLMSALVAERQSMGGKRTMPFSRLSSLDFEYSIHRMLSCAIP